MLTVQLWHGPQLPAAMRQPPLASISLHVRMQAMHAVLQHPWIEELDELDPLLLRRQRGSRARAGREQQQQQEAAAG